jgi:hypothetical protein
MLLTAKHSALLRGVRKLLQVQQQKDIIGSVPKTAALILSISHHPVKQGIRLKRPLKPACRFRHALASL